jgi:hypothetical protein
METPDLSRIVEAHIVVARLETEACLAQLRRDVLPHIRQLQTAGRLRWFSFLLHSAKQVTGQDANDERPVFHLRLEPTPRLDVQEFIGELPSHFLAPHLVELSAFDGVDGSLLHKGDWSRAWRVVGESAEWVLCLIEAHGDVLPPQQAVQFLH